MPKHPDDPPEPWAREIALMEEATGWSADEPWGVAMVLAIAEGKRSVADCRDRIIVEWLSRGDVRPLAHLFAVGRAPAPWVLKYFSGMLSPEVRRSRPDGTRIGYPGELVLKRSGVRHRPANPEIAVRDWLIARNVARLMAEGLPYDKAVAELARDFDIDETRLSTIRRAYDSWRKSTRTKS